jgi:hypothetical protein
MEVQISQICHSPFPQKRKYKYFILYWPRSSKLRCHKTKTASVTKHHNMKACMKFGGRISRFQTLTLCCGGFTASVLWYQHVRSLTYCKCTPHSGHSLDNLSSVLWWRHGLSPQIPISAQPECTPHGGHSLDNHFCVFLQRSLYFASY